MSLAARCIDRPIAVAMAYIAVALLGIVAALRLPIGLLPELDYPRLVVATSWPGAAPRAVDRRLTDPIERTVANVAGVDRVESSAREGESLVTVHFAWGTDMDYAALSVREHLDRLRGALPADAARPAVLRTDPSGEPILAVALGGATPAALAGLAHAVVARRLEQIDGVAQAAITGAPEREIGIDVDAAALEAHGLELRDVAHALAAANVAEPGGRVRDGRVWRPLRTVGGLERAGQMANVALRGGSLRVGDVATVTDGWRDADAVARYNGSAAIALLVYAESGANTVRVAREVDRVLEELRRAYPDIRLDVAASDARFVASAIRDAASALLLGGLLAFGALLLALGEARYPIAVAIAIPMSVLATFACMDALGLSLNVMTLAGLALAVGMLVDNSIVVLDSIERSREPDARVAAARGTEAVQGAVVGVTLTTIVVFAPIAYVGGVAGALLRDVALTVSIALLVSLAVALTLLPMLVSRLPRRASRRRSRAVRGLAGRYGATLAWSLDHPRVLAGATACAALLALGLGAALERSVLPDVDHGAFRVRLELPAGTALEQTSLAAARVEAALLPDPAVLAVLTRVGPQRAFGVVEERRSTEASATLDVRLLPESSAGAVVARLGSALRAAGAAGRVTVETVAAGPLARVLAAAPEPELEPAPGAMARLGIALRLDRDALARHAVAPERVLDAVGAAGRGILATTWREFDRSVPVRVRLAGRERATLEELGALRVDGVPLRRLVRVEASRMPSEVRRGDDRDAVAADRRAMLRRLAAAFALATLLVYMLIAAQFESLLQPLLVMATVPLAAIGAVLALFVTGAGLNAMSLVGMIVLVGVVVDNAIVEVDCINRLRAAGTPLRSAVLEGGMTRLRPIVVSSATTILGTLPLALGLGTGSDLRAPMAIAVVGGLASATLLTLLVVPVLYEQFERRRERA